jgi:integration host factor subunit alpha
MTVTKQVLTEYLYDSIGLPKTEAKLLVDAFFDGIRETLARGEEVKFSGFGSFTVRDKRARPGRNPKTGIPTEITARRVVAFQPSQVLKAHCNPQLNPPRWFYEKKGQS